MERPSNRIFFIFKKAGSRLYEPLKKAGTVKNAFTPDQSMPEEIFQNRDTSIPAVLLYV